MTQMGRITIKKNVTNKAERAIYRNSSGKLKLPLSQPTLLSRRRNEIEYMCRIYFFVSSDVASDGIEVGVSDLLKLCRVKDPDTQKRRIENIRRDRKKKCM